MKELIKKKMHFNALIRSILAEIGIKTTYLVHRHVSFPSGKRRGSGEGSLRRGGCVNVQDRQRLK